MSNVIMPINLNLMDLEKGNDKMIVCPKKVICMARQSINM